MTWQRLFPINALKAKRHKTLLKLRPGLAQKDCLMDQRRNRAYNQTLARQINHTPRTAHLTARIYTITKPRWYKYQHLHLKTPNTIQFIKNCDVSRFNLIKATHAGLQNKPSVIHSSLSTNNISLITGLLVFDIFKGEEISLVNYKQYHMTNTHIYRKVLIFN